MQQDFCHIIHIFSKNCLGLGFNDICYQKCYDPLWEKNVLVIEKKLLKFEAEGRGFANFLRSLEQFIQTVKGQNNFW